MQTAPTAEELSKYVKEKRRTPASMAGYRRLVYPAIGASEDVEKILSEFANARTLRFEEFLKIWKRMNFSLCHAGRVGQREKREFIEELFKIVLKFALFPYTLQVRCPSR